MFAMREIDPSTFDVNTVEQNDVEKDMNVLGFTGVEDLLQEDVQMCLKDFRDADIKVWMLTGDKGLTAKQIGYTCGLLSN